MPSCPHWSEPEKGEQIQHVAAGLAEYYKFIVSACKRRYIIQHGDIKTYHRKVFGRVVPLDYYAGNYRSKDPARPCLAQDVQVNGVLGEPFATVPSAMSTFSSDFVDMISRTDQYLALTISSTERAQAVAQLAAAGMGQLILVHPFLNGNGRMARMLVNYVFKRYGYPMPFRQSLVRPPETEYATASASAMGPSSTFDPLYRYILRLVARAAAMP